MSAFLRHRTFHKQYQECDRKGQHGHHPKAVEIGKRRCLLLPQVFEFLPSHLLRRDRIGGLLEEERLRACDKGIGGRIERIDPLVTGSSLRSTGAPFRDAARANTSPPATRARARGHQLGEPVDRHARAAKRRIPAMILPINRSLIGARVERIRSARAPEMCPF